MRGVDSSPPPGALPLRACTARGLEAGRVAAPLAGKSCLGHLPEAQSHYAHFDSRGKRIARPAWGPLGAFRGPLPPL